MKYLDFRNALKPRLVFNLSDIRKISDNFDRRRLVEWQDAGYITRIRNGHYCFTDFEATELSLFYLANNIYSPSYISLQSAMSYYNLIPEAVFSIVSVSTLKTNYFGTTYSPFVYKNLKHELFFGYKLFKTNNFTIKIAEPEKLILDLCYFNKPKNELDFESLRISQERCIELINFDVLNSYLKIYNSSIMNKRVEMFKNYLYA